MKKKDDKSVVDEMWKASGLAAEEPAAEAEPPKPEEPKKEDKPQDAPTEKKKDIKFLVLYTTVFVIVISALIAGSYMITSRIHKQMAENNAEIDMSQSTLKNIQDENAALKAENAALKESNEALTTARKEAEELVSSVGDMVEQDGYLVAALSAYIDGEEDLAAQILSTIDRAKLSEPNKAHYDLLKEELE
ncbi:MAG: hypothetical protein IJ043_04530 [Clostridia bacterium]|nr:hypothetical protein [Clostridia bacterium]